MRAKIRRSPRIFIITVVMLCSMVLPGIPAADAVTNDEYTVTIGPQDFTWKEFGDDGSRLLKESGTLFAIDFSYWREFQDHMTVKPAAQLFSGTVDYEGHTQSGIPANTEVDYFGIKLQGDVGYLARMGSFSLEPFGGIAFRTWSRDINDSTTIFGSPVIGYTEWWTMFYGRVGARANLDFSKTFSMFAEAGLKLPIDTTNYIDDRNVAYNSITLHPKSKITFFAEAGIKAKMFTISAYYDRMRFKQSDVVFEFDPFLGEVVGFLQPKSESDIIGLKFGLLF